MENSKQTHEAHIHKSSLKTLGRAAKPEEMKLYLQLLVDETAAQHLEPWSVVAGVMLNREAFTTRE